MGSPAQILLASSLDGFKGLLGFMCLTSNNYLIGSPASSFEGLLGFSCPASPDDFLAYLACPDSLVALLDVST